MHDVAVLHHIVFSFHSHLAGFAYGGFRAVTDVIIVFDDFRADKAFFKVRVDDAGTLRGFPSLAEGPGFHFHLSGRDERLQVQQMVDGFDEPVAS